MGTRPTKGDKAAEQLDALSPPDAPAAAPAAAPDKSPAPSAAKAAAPPKGTHGGARPGSGPKPKGKAPTPEEAAAAESARIAARRIELDANSKVVQQALGDLYALPFEVAAAFADTPRVALTPEVKAARGQTAYWAVWTLCPDWTKYMPVFVVGACFVADVGVAVAVIREEKRKRKAGAVPPTAPPVRAVVANLPPPGTPGAAPPGAPPPISA